jgi:DNA-binding transcriptional MocR family regulator
MTGVRLEEPTARGLASAVSQAIGAGTLAAGTRLPPIRQIARELGLSPTTVSAAWQLLARSGTILTDGRRGTVVAEPRTAGPRRYRRALSANGRTAFALDLSTGVPDPALLPDLSPALRRLHATAPSSYLDDPVVPALEATLRASWPSAPQRLAVFDGAMDALERVAGQLLRWGDRAIVENPCFPPLLDLLDALGVQVQGVRLDESGPVPAELSALLTAQPATVFLQPRAQNPTGVSWTPARRDELAAVLAAHPSTVVIEDDSAGDLASGPPPSLGSALPDQTVHIRSFSKSHGPDLRLAAVGGPSSILDAVLERRLLGQGWTSRLLQHLLLDLLTDASTVDFVARARSEYARRRRLITEPLRAAGIAVDGADGINLWLPVADEPAALVALAADGIGAAAGAAFQLGAADPHLRVTIGLVADGHDEVAQSLVHAALAGASKGTLQSRFV